MPRLRLMLAYDGAGFAGSQVQPGQRTVQGDVETALTTLEGQATRATFAGRTDTGVHAAGQVAHCDVHRPWDGEKWRHVLNGVLPPDVRVTNAAIVRDDFHARYDARWRQYRYIVWNGPVLPPLMRHTAWHQRPALNRGAMVDAAGQLVGTHDFASFAGDGKGVPGAAIETVRTVRGARWLAETHVEPIAGASLTFIVEATGFLPHMVRNIVGALVAIGRGDAPPTLIETLLAGRDRRMAPATAPAHGLTLWCVVYDDARQ